MKLWMRVDREEFMRHTSWSIARFSSSTSSAAQLIGLIESRKIKELRSRAFSVSTGLCIYQEPAVIFFVLFSVFFLQKVASRDIRLNISTLFETFSFYFAPLRRIRISYTGRRPPSQLCPCTDARLSWKSPHVYSVRTFSHPYLEEIAQKRLSIPRDPALREI